MNRFPSRIPLSVGLLALSYIAFDSVPAAAHPHVWVTVEAKVVQGPDKTVTGIRHKWTFDELYSQFAIQGLDKKGGNAPTREDLQELAETNVSSLKDFDYFTFAKVNDKKAQLKAPTDYYLELKDGLLSLHFTVPMEKPAALGKDKFSFSVNDPSFFIAFEFAKTNAVGFVGEPPAGCSISLKLPDGDKVEMQKLADSFKKSLDPTANTDLPSDTAAVICK